VFLQLKKRKMVSVSVTVLNWIAFSGWTAIAAFTLSSWSVESKPTERVLHFVLAMEFLCCTETVKIALGMLRGDFMLSFTVHYTRLLMYFITLPHPNVSPLVVKLILLAWSLTEVGRYPMVLFPDSKILKTMRYAVPLVTFPMGAGTEAYAAFLVHQVTPMAENPVLYAALSLVILVNGIFGPVWYPGMVRKVGRSLGESKEGDAKKKS